MRVARARTHGPTDGQESLCPLVCITDQVIQIRPPVDDLGKQVARIVECSLADLLSTHRRVEGPGIEIGTQDADVEP
jgi:hypothetical protein